MFTPLIFEACPLCGGEETASRLAANAEGSIPKDQFISLEKKITYLKDPAKQVGLSVPTIFSHFDICATCGHFYCTKVEVVNLPVQVKQAPGGFPPFGFHPS